VKIKVLLFAGLREKAGKGELELDVEAGTTPRDIPLKIFMNHQLSPGFDRSLRYAVNEDYVKADSVLKEGDEVALIPPVAGG